MVSESFASPPGAVLFACNFNRVRSPMAEVLFKRVVGDRIFADSCGLRRLAGEDAAGVDPLVKAVLGELGLEVGDHAAKTFDELQDNSFDLVISFTPEAQHRAVEMARGRAAEIEYWPIYDPTLTEGSRDARLAAYRDVRDALYAKLAARFGPLVRP